MVSGLGCRGVAARGCDDGVTNDSCFACGWLIAALVEELAAGWGCSAGEKEVARVAEVAGVVLILLEAAVVVVVVEV